MHWNELFVYDEQSPSCLVNKVDRPPKAKAGCAVGWQRKDGYWLFGFKGKDALVHRTIYEMFHGKLEAGIEVDHIDGNRSNNQVSNLRAVSRALNQRNKKRDVRNTSGFAGVSELTVKGRSRYYTYWTAGWKDESGRLKVARYSVDKYGEDGAKALAVARRKQEIERLNDLGLGYTERHGEH